ncbi:MULTISPECIES: hypothetical protein [unclassified Chryseobacterium]|uniref:hypothetical protein n=1 Tax=unclassified Chryseobacterium TaxID=2593645 RepID=UPI0013FDBA79|nr:MULTISPECIES: hypothetical protein [unclassified Chryseobacterium]
MEKETLMQLLDEVATLREIAKYLQCRISKTMIELKINELQHLAETFLSEETE